ncbi:creatininase family protein [Hyphobacterium sp. HN65]|uniref:Creatininase family protein n=1 Tax=Hyphobacterium lacteum TaxID=3116575 RepID=A0ABU7LRN8_9PROT|nr:creatininase family protein [Hyphobacterium sp. HN65]MEE2526579.1 creatininase family protein [Hyphobacterium sp. HN65]
MLLHQSTWQEVEAYLENSRGIIIPIGSTEQHGPNGLLGTDALCPEIIAHEASKASDLLVAPTFNVGIAQHHLAFTGTITLRPSTMLAALLDWIDSLVRHGFDRIYFLNGHGGNVPTIQAAIAESYSDWSLSGEPCPYRLASRNWWELPGMAQVCREVFPIADGSHATASEVAVTYYGYPDSVKSVDMSPKVAPEGNFADAADYRATFPDGRIGSDPSQATPEKGEIITLAARDALISEATRFFQSND